MEVRSALLERLRRDDDDANIAVELWRDEDDESIATEVRVALPVRWRVYDTVSETRLVTAAEVDQEDGTQS
ncbi:hypothetical protein TSUD_178270 [Trifolium subterraneum]|uniref:Uncharacterized protein n=1 Tax=Trifolium subterraneum TaxID=3900 RepID=A0A2Z6LMX0_TRISU|nr:hypothetical protein TSUD_178270 [Trifolium subterraneum]